MKTKEKICFRCCDFKKFLELTRDNAEPYYCEAHGFIMSKKGIGTKATFYYSGGLDLVREHVRMRDNQTCQICKSIWKKGERKFDVHHKDEIMIGYKKKGIIHYNRNNQDKLVTLCHKCHCGLHKQIREQSKLKSIPKKLFIKAVK